MFLRNHVVSDSTAYFRVLKFHTYRLAKWFDLGINPDYGWIILDWDDS